MLKINLGLDNEELYTGCTIEEVAGRKNLTTPVPEAIDIIGRNINNIVSNFTGKRDIVILTGPMAVWCYLIVGHAVIHAFREVRYDDGKDLVVTVAKHG